MSFRLVATILVFAILLLMVIFSLLKKGRIPAKYALVWIFSVMVMALVILIPNLMQGLAKTLGFELLSNMVLCCFIAFLLFITLILTIMIAGQKKKSTLLIQEVSLLKHRQQEEK